MNGFMNGLSWHTDATRKTFWTYTKLGQIGNASGQFVFIDEREESLDDGYFLTVPDLKDNSWGNLPALYHSAASGLSFADGHAEIHKWLDPRTVKPVLLKSMALVVPSGGNLDMRYMSDHASVRLE